MNNNEHLDDFVTYIAYFEFKFNLKIIIKNY